MRHARVRKTLILLVLATLVVMPVSGQRIGANADLIAVNMADTHSAYDAYPAILTAVDRIARLYDGKKLVFLFDGDLFELGNAAAANSDGAADWKFLERLREYGPVVVSIGNHEFDFVAPEEFVATAGEYDVEVVGTVRGEDGELLAPTSVDLDAGGDTVRVVGIATDQMNTYPEAYRETLQIPDPVEWSAQNYAETVEGADYSILLSHAGLVADRKIVAELPENTLFAVGGHDHLVLRESIEGIPYMHNGFRGERINVTEINLTGAEPELTFRDVRTADVRGRNTEMAQMIQATRDDHLSAADRASVGTVPETMSVLEAAMWSVETVRDAVDADVAFLNHTSFGSGLNEGGLAKYRFDQFMRFDNDVMRAEVDAATLRGILARSNQHEDTPLAERTGDFLYASDVEVEDGESYDIVTSSWVSLDFNQERYLGTTEIEFEKVEGVTTKGILTEAMN